MQETIRYIIQFILGEEIESGVANMIGYTNKIEDLGKYRLVIRPSGFFTSQCFGSVDSVPASPLPRIKGIPLLFGSDSFEQIGNTLVTSADIVASAFFLLSRYEEVVCRDCRDKHGRFSAEHSLLYREKSMMTPLVDEYRHLLRDWLRQTGLNIPKVKPGIKHYYLTHDVDAPFYCRTWRNVVRCVLSGDNPLEALRWKFGDVENDCYYTFPFMQEINKRLSVAKSNTSCIYFMKSGGKCREDRPVYNLNSKDVKTLVNSLCHNGDTLGLHASYSSGAFPQHILQEKANLEKALDISVKHNRHHFLRSKEPEDMEALEDAGITDDFTMGYAAHVGFRLGTCRPVRRINPLTGQLGKLMLHPLSIMECSLSDRQYMHLSLEEAMHCCMQIVSKVEEHAGELVLLWHNTSFAINEQSYHRTLYSQLINTLSK